MKKWKAKAAVLPLAVFFVILIIGLWRAHFKEKSFFEAAAIDWNCVEVKRAQWGKNDGVGEYTTLPVPPKELGDILSAVTVRPAPSQSTMPDEFFIFHLELSDETMVELIIGCDGEIIFGPSGSQQFWLDTKGSAYQVLHDKHGFF